MIYYLLKASNRLFKQMGESDDQERTKTSYYIFYYGGCHGHGTYMQGRRCGRQADSGTTGNLRRLRPGLVRTGFPQGCSGSIFAETGNFQGRNPGMSDIEDGEENDLFG